ncbi:MAG TPA: NUDIX domain-containing protein [Kribbellaceae bacterium]
MPDLRPTILRLFRRRSSHGVGYDEGWRGGRGNTQKNPPGARGRRQPAWSAQRGGDRAAREVEEETGWRPGPLERLLSFQPMVSTIDSENVIFLAREAEYVGEAQDVNEAERIAWIELDDVMPMIERGAIVGSSSVVALVAVLNRLSQ